MNPPQPSFSPAMETAARYNKWIIDAFAPLLRGTVLEVGFGHEGFRRLLPDDCPYIAVDIDPEAVRRARRQHPDAAVCEADIADDSLLSALAGRRVDAVLCINVLEHVEDDRTAVANLLSCLVPGGHLCVFVPALPALYNRLDRLAGHRRRYRPHELRALVPPELGRILRIEYFNPLGILGWWLNGALRHSSLASPVVAAQVSIFDRFVCPLSMALDRLTHRVIGQSLVGVFERV